MGFQCHLDIRQGRSRRPSASAILTSTQVTQTPCTCAVPPVLRTVRDGISTMQGMILFGARAPSCMDLLSLVRLMEQQTEQTGVASTRTSKAWTSQHASTWLHFRRSYPSRVPLSCSHHTARLPATMAAAESHLRPFPHCTVTLQVRIAAPAAEPVAATMLRLLVHAETCHSR
jgi:hypothetical protein